MEMKGGVSIVRCVGGRSCLTREVLRAMMSPDTRVVPARVRITRGGECMLTSCLINVQSGQDVFKMS